MSYRFAHACGRLVEVGWLVTILVVPLYFNVTDVRIFEPDKAVVLRDSAAVLGALGLLYLVLRALGFLLAARPVAPPRAVRPLVQPGGGRVGSSLRAVLRCPTLLPMILLAGVTLLATAASLLPALSWQGSYARGEGALTVLAYLTMALLVAGLVRRAAQARRLGAAIALAGLAPAAYGWVQHVGYDPLPWQQADLTARVPGTMGNPIFLGALLVMTIPLALYRLALALHPDKTMVARSVDIAPASARRHSRGSARRRSSTVNVLAILGWAVVVVVEVGGLLFTESRGPFGGLIVALIVFGVGLARAWVLPWLRRGSVLVGGLAVAVLLAANLLSGALGRASGSGALRLLQWSPQTSGTSEVRLLIWRPALTLVVQRPLLGCGPDALLDCYYPVYPTALRHIEAPNAVPDRTHNILLDAAVETGLVGLVALLGVLGVAAYTLARLVAHAAHPARRALAAALLAALAGHVVEGLFGIALVATLLLTWLIAGLAGALAVMEATAPTAVRPVERAAGRARFVQSPDAGPARLRWPALCNRLFVPAPVVALPPHAVEPARLPAPMTTGSKRSWSQTGRADGDAHAADGPSRRRSLIMLGLALPAWLGACWIAWQVITMGATTMAADTADRHGLDLEGAALALSGQTPLPPGREPRPILGLRAFSAAADAQATALRLAPDQEQYSLDAGKTLVEWAQAAGDVGGPARVQAPGLYVRALLLFGQAAHLNPFDPDPLRDTGKAYERWAGLGHNPAAPVTWNAALLARAAQAFARAAQIAPRHPDPLTSWAQVALWQGRTRQALTLVERALTLDSQDGDAYRLRAGVEIARGQIWAALADWRRAVADPYAGQRGSTAARLALAEATWAHDPCAALRDAGLALAEGNVPDERQMSEIVHVDRWRCHAVSRRSGQLAQKSF